MSPTLPGNRFENTTRGKIVLLLRRSDLTVEDLAQELGLTDNAIRAHLATLERDGLVQQSGVRRGQGKPAYCYSLAPEAERLFPKPYAIVVRHTLDLLVERLGPDEVHEMMHALGRHMAGNQILQGAELRPRVLAAVEALNDLGGLAEMEEQEDEFLIRGYSCPVGEVVPDHPEACLMVEALLATWLGTTLQEECERGTPLRCCFRIPIPAEAVQR
jgi:predicted ArsR family transcriptional regulator